WLLEGVDKNTKSIVFSKPLAEVHTSNAEETTFDNIFMLDTTLYLFSSLYKTSEQSLSAYATKINKRNGVFDETQLVYSTSVNKSEKAPEVSYNVSESGKHLLIGCSPFNSEKNSFKIITSTLAEASSTNLSETGNLKMSHYQALCDDSSNIFIYMYHVNKMDEENGYLLSYYAKTKISSFFKVTKPDEVYLYNSSMTITNNKLYFFSFFHSYKMFKGVMVGYERTKGLLSVLINKETNQVLNYNAHYFSRKELIELHGIRKNWEDTLGTYFIQEIIKNNSGDLFLIAEQKTHSHFKFFTYSAGYSGSSNPSEMAPLFYSGYLSILKINKEDAVINWVKLIPKNQMHAVPQYLSYSYTINNDALFFIYNDNNKNMTDSNPFGPATMNNQKTAVGRLAKLTFDGSLEIKNFYLPKANQKFALKPGVFGHSGSNKLLILADKNNQFKYSEIDVSTIK
ncbi:MAG TPA: hypothetical protein VN698_15735, partial [Bacteroidia bacterium]|nr:hypothetical protein [Bacteroidia bacterium]